MNKQNFPFFHRRRVCIRQLLVFVQQLMKSKASTAVIPLASPSWSQDGSSCSRHRAQSGRGERGRPEPAAAVPLYQKSKSFPTRTVPAKFHADLTGHTGLYGHPYLQRKLGKGAVSLVSMVQASKGMWVGGEYRATLSGKVVLSLESTCPLLLLVFIFMQCPTLLDFETRVGGQ